MISIAVFTEAIVVGSYWGFEWGPRAFVCLGFVDYVWNGWHFGSQHAGVVRIYSRKLGSGWPGLERWGIRAFVFLVILRTSSRLLWPQEFDAINSALPHMDWVLLAVPLLLWFGFWVQFNAAQLPKLLYTSSVLALYSLYLLSSHFHWPRMLLCLATAAALFHAVEYLAIVTYYAGRRKTNGSLGVMRWLAERWAVTLTCFVLTIGMLGVYLSGYQAVSGTAWQGLNLWAALIHYAFDGMIWKLHSQLLPSHWGSHEPTMGGLLWYLCIVNCPAVGSTYSCHSCRHGTTVWKSKSVACVRLFKCAALYDSR